MQTQIWHCDAVVYAVSVRTFFDADGDGTGDFAGLTARLDYLQDLGASCLLLEPFLAEGGRHAEGVVDHQAIDPGCGTIADFRAFLDDAHRRGMRVLQAFVGDRTSRLHPWFEAAREARGASSVRDYYHWRDLPHCPHAHPDPQICRSSWDPHRGMFYCHAPSGEPLLNLESPEVQQALVESMRFWADVGVDGLVVVASRPRCAPGDGARAGVPHGGRWLGLRLRDGRDDSPFVLSADLAPVAVDVDTGQIEANAAMRARVLGAALDALSSGDARPLRAALSDGRAGCANGTDRFPGHPAAGRSGASAAVRSPRWFAGLPDSRQADLMAGLRFSLPGPPVIAYGDEIGLDATRPSDLLRHLPPLMQWSGDRNGGFSQAARDRLVAPTNDDPVCGYPAVNVQRQRATAESRLNGVRALLGLRARSTALRRGGLALLAVSEPSVVAYLRESADETVLVVASFSRFALSTELVLPAFRGYGVTEMSSGLDWPSIGSGPYQMTLAPFACYWLHLAPPARAIKESAV